ncbi:MAG: hypothetical protein KatS3mg050_2961 [Litorilinea sp.]|nr:MAG: hypothetical protein KatS3mg050_2961 [Litorilinea sp.]
MASDPRAQVDFTFIRYAQCWEDADVLLQALAIQPHHTCLSIASAGDNTLAMVAQGPQRVIALDLNPAQLACLALRVAAYRALPYEQMLALLGVRPSSCRQELYRCCRPWLSPQERHFWDARPQAIARGIVNVGKFERYLRFFGTRILPLIHSRAVREQLLQPRSRAERERFYVRHWDNWRWRLLFRIFFSRPLLGRLGRDPRFFAYAQEDVAGHLLARTRHALTELDPSQNPYLQWILLGHHGDALPYALRREHFDAIRAHLDCLEWRCLSLEAYLETCAPRSIDRFNLSDIFEYMSPDAYRAVLERLADCGRPGGRLVYWNMLVPRSRPPELAHRLRPLAELAQALHQQDKAFFYRALVVEEIC